MKAAIVGAGIAGLRLADRLRDIGADVRVFEKARGPSGRLATRRTAEGQFDHGAQYFTARTPGFMRQVDDWCRRGVVEEWTGTIASIDRGVMSRESKPQRRYVGVPRMSAIARDLAEKVPLDFSVRIESVRREGQRWTLVTDQGENHGPFDIVVTAVPAPQAVPLLAEVPRLAERAIGVRMLPCHAVMLRFDSEVDVEFDAAFVRSSPLGWISRNGSKPGRKDESCWVLHSTAEWSEAHVDLDSEDVRDRLLAAFGAAIGGSLPAARFSAVHRWLYARPEDSCAERPLWDRDLRIGACGDWTHGDRVEDAFLSAEALADAIDLG